MLLVQAYKELIDHPQRQYQVFVQYPQNWAEKGWLAVFQYDGGPAAQIREQDKFDRLIGVFDHRIDELAFYRICTRACLEYRFKDKDRGVCCPIVTDWSRLNDDILADLVKDANLIARRRY